MEHKPRAPTRNLDLTKVDNGRLESTMRLHQSFVSEAWTDLVVVLGDVIGPPKMAAALRRRIAEVTMTPRTEAARDLLAEALRAVELRDARPGR